MSVYFFLTNPVSILKVFYHLKMFTQFQPQNTLVGKHVPENFQNFLDVKKKFLLKLSPIFKILPNTNGKN